MNLDLFCPQCNRVDWVQSVPAAVAEGTHTGFSSGVHSGIGTIAGGLVPVVGTSSHEFSHSSAVAKSLALAPTLPTAGRLTAFAVLLMLPAAGFYGAAYIGYSMDPPESSNPIRFLASLAGLLCFPVAWSLPVVIMLTVAVKRVRRSNRVGFGRGRAHSVWQRAYYCHRCAVAFWPEPTAPGLPYRVALSPSDFRRHVWAFGGYADL